MVAGHITETITLEVALERVWKASVDSDKLMPIVQAVLVSKTEIIEGDGGVGTIKKHHLNKEITGFEYMVEKLVVLDHENHEFKYSVLEGGLIGLRLKAQSTGFKFSADGAGSVGNLTVEYETLDDTDLSAEEKGKIAGGLVGMIKAVEGYLVANPGAYA